MALSNIPSQVFDYAVLPLTLPPLPSYPIRATHYLYLRPHEPKLPHPDSSRSLFLVNVPFDSTDLHFRSLFTEQLDGGRVERVDFETSRSTRKAVAKTPLSAPNRKRKRSDVEAGDLAPGLPETWDRELHASGSTAVVVFVDRPSMELALKAARKAVRKGTEIVWGKGLEDRLPSLGSHRYLAHHTLRYPPPDELQATVDTYMTAFAAAEATRARKLTRQRQIPDADGFITVTRGGRTGPARVEEAQEKMEELKKKEEDKRQGMGDFYRFQVRERKKQRAGELVRRFEEDRKRVDEMRKQRGRRFRPT